MEAKIQKATVEDNPSSDLETVIVISPSDDSFFSVWETLKGAGFILRNWEDDKIIIYSPKSKKAEALKKVAEVKEK